MRDKQSITIINYRFRQIEFCEYFIEYDVCQTFCVSIFSRKNISSIFDIMINNNQNEIKHEFVQFVKK